MRYDNLIMFGRVYRKKEPNNWEMNGQKGTSYSIFFDTYEAVAGIQADGITTLKVSEDIYNSVIVGGYYALVVSVNIDERRDGTSDRSGLQVRSILSDSVEPFSFNKNTSGKSVGADADTSGRHSK